MRLRRPIKITYAADLYGRNTVVRVYYWHDDQTVEGLPGLGWRVKSYVQDGKHKDRYYAFKVSG